MRHIAGIIIFLIIFLAYSRGGFADDGPAFNNPGGILGMRRTKSIIKSINAKYYDLMKEDVEDIKFIFELSDEGRNLQRLRKRGGGSIAEKIENMDIVITCYPTLNEIEVAVLNRPSFYDKEIERSVDDIIKATKEIAGEFLTIWKRYVTRLIDPRFNQVKAVTEINGDMSIVLVDRGSKEYRLVFDPEQRLKFWEASELFETEQSYKEMPQFEIHDSKYLIKTVHAENFGKFEISYQSINGIKIPEKVDFYSENPDLPDTAMLFKDARVNRRQY